MNSSCNQNKLQSRLLPPPQIFSWEVTPSVAPLHMNRRYTPLEPTRDSDIQTDHLGCLTNYTIYFRTMLHSKIRARRIIPSSLQHDMEGYVIKGSCCAWSWVDAPNTRQPPVNEVLVWCLEDEQNIDFFFFLLYRSKRLSFSLT
jgi:hypothetical protein